MATPYRVLQTTSGLRSVLILISETMTIALTLTHHQESRGTWNLSSNYVWKISDHWTRESLQSSRFLPWNGNLLCQKPKAQDMHHFAYGLLERPRSHRIHCTATKIQFKNPPPFSEQAWFGLHISLFSVALPPRDSGANTSRTNYVHAAASCVWPCLEEWTRS